MKPDPLTQSLSYAPKPVSETFGKYQLFERIGAGGMAEVFRAVAIGPENFQRTLVIKRILPHLSQDAAFVQMFIDEAKVSGVLSHPNLAQIFEFGKIDQSFYIAMEHVHGRTLAATLKRASQNDRRIPVPATVEIARQLCTGLEYAHSLRSADGNPLGIVHRDITPSNLMLSFHGAVKMILDFGIARVVDGLRQTHTQIGALKGKISYMSPEQTQGHAIDSRSDIFSLGIVLHEVLSGRRLFRADSAFRASRMVLEMPIEPPSLHNPAVSAALDRVVMRALERDVVARYQTTTAMAADLEQVMLEERMSPREHIKLLHQLFPTEASTAADAGVVVTAAPAQQPGERAAPADSAEAVPVTGRTAREDALLSGATASGAGVTRQLPIEPPLRRQKRRRLLILGAAAGVVLGGAALATRQLRARPASATTPPATAVAPSVERPARPSPVAVRCSLDSTPQDAIVTRVDPDAVIGRTPLTVSLPVSSEAIVFRFEKPGYRTATHKVIPDLDKVVHVDLGAAGDEPPVVQREPPENRAQAPARAIAARHRPAAASQTAKPHPPPKSAATQVRTATPINPFDM